MDERSRVLMAACLGAVAGGIWGWLYLTENGRHMREQIEPRLDDLIGEIFGNGVDHFSDRVLFIQSRDDDRDVWLSHGCDRYVAVLHL